MSNNPMFWVALSLSVLFSFVKPASAFEGVAIVAFSVGWMVVAAKHLWRELSPPKEEKK